MTSAGGMDNEDSIGDVEADGGIVSVYKSGRWVELMTSRPLTRMTRDEACDLRDLLTAATLTAGGR